MKINFMPVRGMLCLLLIVTAVGCGSAARTYPLNPKVARTSLEKAMQAWVDGKNPKDLQPEIIVGDFAWDAGTKLTSFEILTNDETLEGSNLHVRVKRKFEGKGKVKPAESTVKYIVSTSPVITIFPQ